MIKDCCAFPFHEYHDGILTILCFVFWVLGFGSGQRYIIIALRKPCVLRLQSSILDFSYHFNFRILPLLPCEAGHILYITILLHVRDETDCHAFAESHSSLKADLASDNPSIVLQHHDRSIGGHD